MKAIAIAIIFILTQMINPVIANGNFHYECKNVMAVGNATAGDYNLLLKVRDPARPGYQVLCIVPKGYEYDYHSPWLGYKMHFVVEHKFIGTTTLGDVPPNIVKPGMLISDAGIAFGDADTLCHIVNPTRHAWDDFDWMRYAAQSADDLNDAISLLHRVVQMHAPSVAENIFVVNATMGAIVEADAINFNVRFIENGVEAQSNYPKVLWRKHLIYPIFVSSSFYSNKSIWAEKGQRISLGGLTGIYVSNIGNDSVTVRMYPFGFKHEIKSNNGMAVGNFWVEVKDISGGKAKLFICYKYFMWEKKIKEELTKNGKVRLEDMMRISRLHTRELNGLRGMCEGGYEAATVYKITRAYPQFLSSLWFAANQCASIFVPVHICDIDIYDAYENGTASQLAHQLLSKYGHGNITKWCEQIEKKFIERAEKNETEAMKLINQGKIVEAKLLLTISDIKMQMEAIEIEKDWLNGNFSVNFSFQKQESHHL